MRACLAFAFLLWLIFASVGFCDDVSFAGSFLVEISDPPPSLARATTLSAEGWTFQALGAGLGKQRANSLWVVAIPPVLRDAKGRLLAPVGADVKRGWEAAYKELPTLNRVIGRGSKIALIEPNFSLSSGQKLDKPTNRSDQTKDLGPHDADVDKAWNKAWPTPGRFAWHLEGDSESGGYSALKKARDFVAEKVGHHPDVTIAQLDTGYDPHHITCPRRIDKDRSITYDRNGKEVPGKGVAKGVNHGTGALGILAGNHIRTEEGFDDDLGGAPDAKIIAVNIHAGSSVQDVVHLTTASMSAGILYAVENNADVISISAGGIPSHAWAYAVNRAYENGTAIFAASGDFLTIPLIGIPFTPYRTVYPAAFPRVISVTGATSAFGSYGRRGSTAALLPWNWKAAMMRGNYGPPRDMSHTIAAFAPNIPWAQLSESDQPHRLIRVSGGGTSSTTPQAAAAAALWLSVYGGELPPHGQENSWRRAEAAYDALRRSVSKEHHADLYRDTYLGWGYLNALKAVREFPPSTDLSPRAEARAGFGWLRLLLPIDPDQVLGRARLQALELEAAQIVARSRSLQRLTKMLDDPYTDATIRGSDQERNQKIRLAKAIAANRMCSSDLRDALRSGVKAFQQR